MVTISIDIISDITCVWCFIGKRTLFQAISLYQKTYPNGKSDTFKITWRPYYLDRNQFDGHSVDKAELTKARLADWSPEKIAAAENRVNQVGRSLGINFNFGGKIGSTRDAHRLIHLCQIEGRDSKTRDDVVEEIFQAYHEKALDISDVNILERIALEAGLDEKVVHEWMNSEHDGIVVDNEAAANRKLTTAGVPFFIIQGVHHVDGAQDLQEFLETFIKIRESDEGRTN